MTPTRAPEYPAPTLLERGLDLLFPPTCVACRRIGKWICAECWDSIDWLLPQTCASCGHTWPTTDCLRCSGAMRQLDGLFAVATFEGVAREAVHALKYHGRHAISPLMGSVMARAVRDQPFTLVAPISLHPRRRRERGYDQAAMLARALARSLDAMCDPSAIRRIRYTTTQTALDPMARRANVQGAFEASPVVEGERVLLVDDVFTTGATMEAAAASVKATGAESVVGVVFGCVVSSEPAGHSIDSA